LKNKLVYHSLSLFLACMIHRRTSSVEEIYIYRVYTEGLQIVVNLSSWTLTEAESSLLSKGLSFCPTPAEVDTYALKKDVLEFIR